jgi:hypothetical protein
MNFKAVSPHERSQNHPPWIIFRELFSNISTQLCVLLLASREPKVQSAGSLSIGFAAASSSDSFADPTSEVSAKPNRVHRFAVTLSRFFHRANFCVPIIFHELPRDEFRHRDPSAATRTEQPRLEKITAVTGCLFLRYNSVIGVESEQKCLT